MFFFWTTADGLWHTTMEQVPGFACRILLDSDVGGVSNKVEGLERTVARQRT